MATTTIDATLTLIYEDDTKRNLTFKDVPSSGLANMKAKIIAMNQTLADSISAAPYKETFISDEGEPIAQIGGGKIVQTMEEVIYNA